jgi:hypothetical protein
MLTLETRGTYLVEAIHQWWGGGDDGERERAAEIARLPFSTSDGLYLSTSGSYGSSLWIL